MVFSKSLADVLRWQWNAARKGLPQPPLSPTPQVAPDLAFLRPTLMGVGLLERAVALRLAVLARHAVDFNVLVTVSSANVGRGLEIVYTSQAKDFFPGL